MSANTKEQSPKKASKSGVVKRSVRINKTTPAAKKLNIIEQKYGPDRGINEPEQLEAFYRHLENSGQKSLSDLIRPQ